VKEPFLGSLGMASLDEITAIAKLNRSESSAIPLSVALGEVTDWLSRNQYPDLPEGITFAKLGMNRCALNENWRAEWMNVREEFERRSRSRLNWVAVAYADVTEAMSPDIAEMVEAAVETRCAGLLIDTWTKDGRTLLDIIDEKVLTAIANECHASGLFFAIAGKLNRESLPVAAPIPADVIAIRSAACRGVDRTAEIDSRQITDFRSEMRRSFDRSHVPIPDRHARPV
jgi:uncharacterized protein (UPF0264 family)